MLRKSKCYAELAAVTLPFSCCIFCRFCCYRRWYDDGECWLRASGDNCYFNVMTLVYEGISLSMGSDAWIN